MLPYKIDKSILIDSNIPHAGKLFSGFERIKFFDPLKGLDPVDNPEQVEVLIIRSTLQVDRNLFSRMPRLAFIGTTTAGRDHIHNEGDKIHVASAPGCNAGAVCDYVFYALFSLDGFLRRRFRDLKFGVVGVGHVGGRIWSRAKRFGFRTVLVDPPRKKSVPKFPGAPFRELYDCDIVSLHVPLIKKGEYPTVGMAGEEFFEKIKPGAVFINTSRGEVIDEEALIEYGGKLGGVIVDVYRNEPFPRADLIEAADIATPHVAGHTHQAFYRGALMVARGCYRYFQRPDLASELTGVETLYPRQERRVPQMKADSVDRFQAVLASVFDIGAATRLTKKQARSFTPAGFARLRSQLRREENRFITLCFNASEGDLLPHLLDGMGFTLKGSAAAPV